MNEKPPKGLPDVSAPTQTLEAYTAGPSEFDIPAHRLHPAEADLRFVVNTTSRERPHWWIAMIRRHQAECSRCRRCDGQAA